MKVLLPSDQAVHQVMTALYEGEPFTLTGYAGEVITLQPCKVSATYLEANRMKMTAQVVVQGTERTLSFSYLFECMDCFHRFLQDPMSPSADLH